MDFALTSEQEELIRTLRAFSKRELAPRSGHWDKSGEFPWDVWRQMGELGLFGFRAPAEFGGHESDLLTMGIATEEIARGDFGATYGIQLAGLAGEIIGKNGSDEVKRRWLPPTVRGEAIVSIARGHRLDRADRADRRLRRRQPRVSRRPRGRGVRDHR